MIPLLALCKQYAPDRHSVNIASLPRISWTDLTEACDRTSTDFAPVQKWLNALYDIAVNPNSDQVERVYAEAKIHHYRQVLDLGGSIKRLYCSDRGLCQECGDQLQPANDLNICAACLGAWAGGAA
jgi:hypothetical protein